MKKMIFPACYLFGTILTLSSCSNAQSNQASTEVVQTQDEHADHHHTSDHNHTQHSQNSTPTVDITQAAPAQDIPPFTFYKVKSGVSFTNADIPKGKNTAFILFDPNCSHCKTEAAALAKNYNKLKNVNIYFVSMNDPALQASFLETFAKELVGKPNVEVLYDRNQDFIQKFHVPKQYPANYVYGKDQKLVTYWDGDKDINEIIKAYTK